MKHLLDLHAHNARPDAVELAERNRDSGVASAVPVYRTDPTSPQEGFVWVSLEHWPRLKYWNGTQVIVLASSGMSQDRGDADVTLTLDDAPTQYFRTTFTANRTVALPVTAENGDYFEIVRNPASTGAFTLAIGSAPLLATIPASTKARVRVEHDGTAWRLVGYGTLP